MDRVSRPLHAHRHGSRHWFIAFAAALFLLSACAHLATAQDATGVRFSEILAGNATTDFRDGDGERQDWIELVNTGDAAADLSGHFLSNRDDFPNQWPFPEGTVVAPGAYLVVFASGAGVPDTAGNLHANFRLRIEGEFLALVARDGATVVDGFTPAFPRQVPDVSFGRDPAGAEARYFGVPTPGAPNAAGFEGVVADTSFSIDRGFFDEPFDLTISSATEGAAIRYTLDGSKPTETAGLLHDAPVRITSTATVRAIAFKEGYLSTNVDTHTYLFLADVEKQPSDPEGYPGSWGNDGEVGRVVSDYAMDPRVVENALPGYSVRDALLSIPTISIVLPVSDVFGTSRGIYTHPLSEGDAWEREASVELIHPDGSKGFQVNAGIRMQGNSSRRPKRMQKHSFRINFRSQYGTSRLRYPLISDSPVEEFDKLVLRACFTDSWGLVSWGATRYRPNDSQYIRDVWMKQSQRDMGHLSGNSTFAHLYLNGLYWGLYNPAERLDDTFFTNHLGGNEDDWDIVRDFDELLRGSKADWNTAHSLVRSAEDNTTYMAIQGRNPDGSLNPELKNLIDVVNLADYMLLHFFADAEDWPSHNLYAARNRNRNDGFIFLVWDQEIVLDNHAMNRINSNDRGPGQLFQGLRANEDFRLLFADRVNRHLFNGGALSLEACQQRYLAVANRIDKAIVGESARWGDTQSSTPYSDPIPRPRDPENVDDPAFPAPPNGPDHYFTREQSWLVERDNVLNNYLPAIYDTSNSTALLRKLRARDLYPETDAPSFSQHGGMIPGDFSLEISNPNAAGAGVIFATTDGTDPRAQTTAGTLVTLVPEDAPKRALMPVDGALDAAQPDWRSPEFDDSDWSQGTLGAGYETSASALYAPLIDPQFDFAARISPLAPESVYIRTTFEVSDPSDITSLTARMRYDDGFVAYLNGEEVGRANATGEPTWDSAADSSHPDNAAVEFEDFEIDAVHLAALRAGTNVFAIHGLNQGNGGSDFLIHGALVGTSGGNPAGISDSAFAYSQPLPVGATTHVKARILNDGEWSALTEATFLRAELAAPGNVLVSEIMYHPADNADLEFIELHNPTAVDVVLDGATFTAGVAFTFAKDTVLSAGQRLVLVRELALFVERHGSAIPVAGEYAGALANGGELLTLSAADGSQIFSVDYGDAAPWPTGADGGGFSLVLGDPGAPQDASSWQAGSVVGGTPGQGERAGVTFTGDPAADEDGDGVPALLEFATGTSDDHFNAQPAPAISLAAGNLRLSFPLRRDAGLSWSLEFSQDLAAWAPVGEALNTEIEAAGALDVVHVSVSVSREAAAATVYYRVRYALAP